MQATKIKKDVFRHVEAELYTYPETRREIIRLRSEIMYPFDERSEDTNIVKGANSARMPGDPTGRTAIRLVSDRRLRYLETVADAIETVINALSPDKQKLVKLKYWTRPQLLTWEGIARELNVSRRTAINWRDEIVQVIAELIGWK